MGVTGLDWDALGTKGRYTFQSSPHLGQTRPFDFRFPLTPGPRDGVLTYFGDVD